MTCLGPVGSAGPEQPIVVHCIVCRQESVEQSREQRSLGFKVGVLGVDKP
jgi:hypothetical protein